eukprot:2308415-Alexandrium_andersonii.AAC.1
MVSKWCPDQRPWRRHLERLRRRRPRRGTSGMPPIGRDELDREAQHLEPYTIRAASHAEAQAAK